MLSLMINLGIIFTSVICVFIATLIVVRKYRLSNKDKCLKAGTCVVLGSGGHTTEMLKLVSTLDRQKFSPRTYFIASTDDFSIKKLKKFEKGYDDYKVHVIPRAREVGQSYFTSVFTSFRALVWCISPVYQLEGDVLLVNGPGTCLPICLLYMLTHPAGKVIYVESICRVKTLSLSCKLLRKFVTQTLVQWEELSEKYPDTKFIGKLV